MTKVKLVIAVDDTDNPEGGGTGSVARALAARLEGTYPVHGVTRHQLAVLPEINFTKKNSANVIHLLEAPEDLTHIIAEATACLEELRLEGSEPGLCVAGTELVRGVALGCEAKERFVTRDEARAAAEAAGAVLLHPCGGDGGIVGAFAGACLAAGGDDGRFVQVGRMRELSGEVTVQDVLTAGGDEVRTEEDQPLTEGIIIAERLRPALRRGRCVVYCRRRADGLWEPLKGAPGDAEREEQLHAAT